MRKTCKTVQFVTCFADYRKLTTGSRNDEYKLNIIAIEGKQTKTTFATFVTSLDTRMTNSVRSRLLIKPPPLVSYVKRPDVKSGSFRHRHQGPRSGTRVPALFNIQYIMTVNFMSFSGC